MPTPPPSPSYRGRHWFLGTAISAALVLAMASLASDCSDSPPAEARVEPAERPPAPSLPAPPPVAAPAPVASAPAPAPERPGAPFDPNAPTAPPSEVDLHAEEIPIPPEQPQTVEWKLTKTTLVTLALKKRIRRLEAEIGEAEARGDQEEARSRRALLERSRQRVAELEQEIARLREQVQSGDGGQVIAPGPPGHAR